MDCMYSASHIQCCWYSRNSTRLFSAALLPVGRREGSTCLQSSASYVSLLLLLQDFSYDDSKVEFNVDAPNGVVMEGYLFKRASNAFKTWNR